MKKQVTKIRRTISIDMKLNKIMEDLLLNKSKYIEQLIMRDMIKINYKK
mgnify:CR=1 FL=1